MSKSMAGADYPAFPWTEQSGIYWPGLTKREYFAAMALQGMLAVSLPNDDYSPAYMADIAVVQADALVQRLEKK